MACFFGGSRQQEVGECPPLTEILKEEQAAQWVCVNAMGVAILENALSVIKRSFAAWNLGSVRFGGVQNPTQTDMFYRTLIDSGFEKPLEKINAIDTLIHCERGYEDTLPKILGALEVALRPICQGGSTERSKNNTRELHSNYRMLRRYTHLRDYRTIANILRAVEGRPPLPTPSSWCYPRIFPRTQDNSHTDIGG